MELYDNDFFHSMGWYDKFFYGQILHKTQKWIFSYMFPMLVLKFDFCRTDRSYDVCVFYNHVHFHTFLACIRW